jgi:excisionase family DNA binding protein
MTIPEVAEILEIATCTLRRYIRRRLLPVVILPGNDYRILEKDLKKFLDDRRIDPDEPKGPKDR